MRGQVVQAGLSGTDKSDLVDIANAAELNSDSIKTSVIDAITAHGGSVASPQSWTDVMNGIGTPDRAGDNASSGNSISGTTLKLVAPQGYYDGVDDTVTITDADFVAENIKTGINLFGKVGNMASKKSASGTINRNYDASAITVSGLDFTPTKVVFTLRGYSYWTGNYYTQTGVISSTASLYDTYSAGKTAYAVSAHSGPYSGSTNPYTIGVKHSSSYITTNGFTIPAMYNDQYYTFNIDWYAFE